MPEMKIMFDLRYSSHVNATAGPGADDDTIFSFLLDTHKAENPFISNDDPDVRVNSDRYGTPFWKFIRGCMTGEPLSVDLLFLPEFAYIVAPPRIVMDHRSIFVTRNTFRKYLELADRKRFHSTIPGRGKAAYHSLLYLNSARAIATRGRPSFLDPSFIDILLKVKQEGPGSTYETIYDEIRASVGAMRPDLPDSPNWKFVTTIYNEAIAVERPMSEEVWKCMGCDTPTSQPGMRSGEDRGGNDWWLKVGPLLWKELHEWALSRPKPETIRRWLAAFSDRIPCGSCRDHWVELTTRFPAPDDPALIFEWTVDRHNDVNDTLKKGRMAHDEAKRRWAA